MAFLSKVGSACKGGGGETGGWWDSWPFPYRLFVFVGFRVEGYGLRALHGRPVLLGLAVPYHTLSPAVVGRNITELHKEERRTRRATQS